jgi:hypothetical protein
MAGKAGTPRFGEYITDISGKPGDDGINVATQQSGNRFSEQHNLYNPAQQSRPMGTTLGGDPGESYVPGVRIYNAHCNHDGFMGGQDHINQLDEAKVLNETIFAVPYVCADDWFQNSGSDERTA